MRRVDGTRRVVALIISGTVWFAGTARAESPEPPLIWYRSGEGCPDGAGFLERLAARGVKGKLAGVGDPIDFVVTLGTGPDGPRGLLERQTKTGTVAIRRLDGGTCDEIADGLALSLSLADAPEERRREPVPSTPGPNSEKNPEPVATEPARDHATSEPPPAPRASSARFAIGLQGNAVFRVAPDPMPGVSLFLDFEPGGAGLLARSSIRAGAFGFSGGSSVEGYDFRTWVAGGRVGACPTWLGSPSVRVHPCVAMDLGTIRTVGTGATGHASGAFWAAAGFGLRLDVPVSDRFALEAQADAQFPLTRYDIVAGPAEITLFKTAAATFGGSIGAYFTLP